MQQIIIPWRDSGCEYRLKHFNFLCKYYGQRFDIVIGDNDGIFTRAGARNAGVAKSTSQVLAIIDADTYIPLNKLESAINFANNNNKLVRPFERIWYLTEDGTNKLYANGFTDFSHVYDGSQIGMAFIGSPGGAFVLHRRLWEQEGGFDERFVGWGGEDNAFTNHYNIRFGIKVIGVDAFHLYHPARRGMSNDNNGRVRGHNAEE